MLFAKKRLIMFRLLVMTAAAIPLIGCGGSGPDGTSTSQNQAAPSSINQTQGWPGRAWYVSNQTQLFSGRYADSNSTLIDNDLSPAENTNTPAVVVSKNGQYYASRASNSDVTESHFSIRRASDAKEVGYFWSSRHSGVAAISNDGRYVAWVSAANFSNYLNGIYDLYLTDTKVGGGSGVKTIHAWPFGSASAEPKVLGFDWTWDDRLLLFLSTRQIEAYSPITDQLVEIGQLPEKYDGKTIQVGNTHVNRDATRLAGTMWVSPGNTEIWVSKIDGSDVHQNTAVGTVITNVDWAPSGDSLHGGDCRGVIYGSPPAINTGGRYSWIVPSDTINLSLQDSKKFTAEFKEEIYPHFLRCDFIWTE